MFATVRQEKDLAPLEADGLEALILDYTRQDTIDALVHEVLRRTGGTLDALFNNGAYGQPARWKTCRRMRFACSLKPMCLVGMS